VRQSTSRVPLFFSPISAPRCRRQWRLLLLVLAGLGADWAIAQDVSRPKPPPDNFARLSDEEGLTHSDVRAVVQDHEGYLWFGLRLGGLTRYDGYELKAYQHDPADLRTIGHRVIWSVIVDRHDTVWIGTEGGLDRLDRSTDTFVHYRHDPTRPDSLANNNVTCVFEDSTGHIWAGTREGLCRLDDPGRGTFTTFTRPQLVEGSTAKDTYRAITEDPKTGLFWLGATDGLAAFDPRTGMFASYLHDPADPESPSRNAVNKIVRAPDGVFWALTEFGINSFTPDFDHVSEHTLQKPRIAFRRFRQPGDPTMAGANYVRDGVIDRQGFFWLGTRGGLQLFDRATGNFTGYRRNPSDPTSLSDDLTQSVFEDRDGNIWVGTYTGGANVLRRAAKPFVTYRHDPAAANSLSENRVNGLAFDPGGRLWAATTYGLNRLDATGWKRFIHDPNDPDSIPTNDLASLAFGPTGEMWIATNYNGIYRFDHERFQSYPTSPWNIPAANGWQPFTGVQVHSILPDSKGGAWIGARSHGLDYFSGGKFLHYNPQERGGDALAQPTKNAAFGFFDEDKALWFITEASGLIRFESRTQHFTVFEPPPESPGMKRTLVCLIRDDDGTIWLGAADGLLHFDPKTGGFLRPYSTTDGLPHASIMTIVRDRRGHLWLATANGLADFNPANGKIRTYDKADGLPSNVFAPRCGALGPDGRVYLGTRNGILSFAPEELRDNPNPPPVVITDVHWLGASSTHGSGSPTNPRLIPGQPLRVPPGQLGFSLKFSALDFTAPEKNRFRYRLEGLDATWSSTTARERSATYTALRPGHYRFHVQASNADGVWNERGAALEVIVEPHAWQTVPFRVALGLAIAGIITLGFHLRLRGIARRNTLLEHQVSRRTVQLRQEVSVRERAEAALRESYAELERRVQSRTSELAQTNANLQTEVSERKNVEAQLRQSQKMDAIGQLAGGVAHDFNNLLTVILGQSELMGDPRMPPSAWQAALRDIRSAAQRATNLTRQLLVFSRHQPVNPVAIDLNQVVTNVSKLLDHVIGEQINLETRLDPDPLGVLVDPGMLEQVLINLAVNARDAMPRGGRLSISTAPIIVDAQHARRSGAQARPGGFVRCSVSDRGGGIPANILPEIFEPFFTTKEAGKGTGLGLAISLGIVQKHHGWIEVETEVGEGTTFHIYLPSQPLPSDKSTPRHELRAHSSGKAATVLLAEDELAVRAVVNLVLTRQGYRVIEAVSGADALEKWAAHRDEISILITDIVMPGWPDGHELAARLLKEKPSLRVVTMSGYDPGEAAGMPRTHLRKPFTAEDLLAMLDSTTRG
jgi:signal transduction histidine kinase/ligand-binding sensor domain-containing protein/CheY-like chemotaxis protein